MPQLSNARGEKRSDGRVRTMLLLVPSVLATRVGSLSLRSRLTKHVLVVALSNKFWIVNVCHRDAHETFAAPDLALDLDALPPEKMAHPPVKLSLG